jgi:glc operon protein GlcG
MYDSSSQADLNRKIGSIIGALDALIPEYSSNPADAFAGGNVAVCIIDANGGIHGNIWGTDKVRGRNSFRLAWVKASQVWITGMKTGDYEKRLFNEEFDEGKYGIQKPDLIGWEGGQPVRLADGTVLSVGFSGFRGINDLEIVVRAVAAVEKMK